MKPLIIFDMDWTLIKLVMTWDDVIEELSELFGKYGVQLDTRGNIIAEVFSKSSNMKEGKKLLKQAYSIIDKYEAVGSKNAVVLGNSPSILKELEQNYNLAIVSNNGDKAIKAALKTVGVPLKTFKAIISRDIHEKPKPSPVPIIEILKKFPGTKVVYVVGDEPVDILCGKAAAKLINGVSIYTIGIMGGWVGKEKVLRSRPDFVIKNIDELPALLSKQPL